MIRKNLQFKYILSLSVLLILLSSSCASKKEVVYFQGLGDFETLVDKNSFTPKFKVDDLVNIHISTLDPEASVAFNLYRGASEGGLVGGHEEVRELLRDKLSPYLRNPIINIRLQNFTITVLGQVNRPGTYPVVGERISIMEALGFAGDLNVKGVRDNVMVIRDFDGTKVTHRIDLTSKEALNSPVYYLTQNDVVYVEPNQSAVSSSSLDNRATIAISIGSTLVTAAVILLTRQ